MSVLATVLATRAASFNKSRILANVSFPAPPTARGGMVMCSEAMLLDSEDNFRPGLETHKHCITCALTGNSCCTANHPFVLATDVQRAQRGLGRSASQFFCTQRIAPNSGRSARFTSLVASLYYVYCGDLYRLQMRHCGRWCIALEDRVGCILGAFRPLSCKLFPVIPVPDFGTRVDVLKHTYSVSVECQLANACKFQVEEICSAFGETLFQKVQEARQWEEEQKQHSFLLERAARLGVAPENLLPFLLAPG